MQKLQGKQLQHLQVLKDTGSKKVLCLCLLCGRQKEINRYALTKSERPTQSCGCLRRISGKNNAKILATKKDLTGKKLEGIEVLGFTGTKKGTNKVYRCRCLYCGKIFETAGSNLTRSDTTSCGCKKIKQATDQITRDCIDGTKISTLTSKIRSDNTSGTKGVSQIKRNGYWVAYIGFRGVRYQLYYGSDKEEAIKRRKLAEQNIHGEFLEWIKCEMPEQWEIINRNKC